MKILLTGATGFIGKHLISRLIEYTHEPLLLVRSADKARRLFGDKIRIVTDLEQLDSGEQIDGIINLAGEGIADQRWSEQRKQALLDSRLDTTRQLIQFIKRLEHKPEVLISGSAVGYYGSQEGDLILAEDSVAVDDYPHRLCQQWEEVAEEAQSYGLRVCLIRTGIVLGHGGALAKMLPAFRLGLGGRIAGGQQWMSWIHIEDEVEVI